MSGQDLYLELQGHMAMLNKTMRALEPHGRAAAQADHDYRVALTQKILTERDKGTPVTIVSDVCRGDREIARLRLERDIADVVYKSAMEAINCYKLQIKVLENQIDREWNNV